MLPSESLSLRCSDAFVRESELFFSLLNLSSKSLSLRTSDAFVGGCERGYTSRLFIWPACVPLCELVLRLLIPSRESLSYLRNLWTHPQSVWACLLSLVYLEISFILSSGILSSSFPSVRLSLDSTKLHSYWAGLQNDFWLVSFWMGSVSSFLELFYDATEPVSGVISALSKRTPSLISSFPEGCPGTVTEVVVGVSCVSSDHSGAWFHCPLLLLRLSVETLSLSVEWFVYRRITWRA